MGSGSLFLGKSLSHSGLSAHKGGNDLSGKCLVTGELRLRVGLAHHTHQTLDCWVAEKKAGLRARGSLECSLTAGQAVRSLGSYLQHTSGLTEWS